MSYDYSQNERVSSYACDLLLEAVRDPDSNASTLPYEERLRNLEEYSSSTDGIAAPFYDNLGEVLSSVGMSYRSFFSVLGTPLKWPDAQTAAMAEKLEKLADLPDRLEFLHRFTQSMLPEVWTSEVWGHTPSYRLHMWRMYVCDPAKRVQIRNDYKECFPRFFDGTDARSRVNTEDIVRLGLLYGAPLHWLLCLAPEETLMASIPVVEVLMDDYIRLPDIAKHTVEAMVDYVVHILERDE